jgi:hypothetical protein
LHPTAEMCLSPLHRPPVAASTPALDPKVARFGLEVPPSKSRSVLVVSHHLDGFLRCCGRGLVASRCRSWGSSCFWPESPAIKPVEPRDVPTMQDLPLEEFPSTAVPRRRGRCPRAVGSRPPVRRPRCCCQRRVDRIGRVVSVGFEALLRLRVWCLPSSLPTIGDPLLPGLCSSSRSLHLQPEIHLPLHRRVPVAPERAVWMRQLRVAPGTFHGRSRGPGFESSERRSVRSFEGDRARRAGLWHRVIRAPKSTNPCGEHRARHRSDARVSRHRDRGPKPGVGTRCGPSLWQFAVRRTFRAVGARCRSLSEPKSRGLVHGGLPRRVQRPR